MRLRRVDCGAPGITRRRRGRGFEYRRNGRRLADPSELERIRALAIPPAWEDVWICPDERGHLQATGTDAAGRKQYRYHDRWRERRDSEKFDAMIEFVQALPRLRRRVTRDLGRSGMPAERVLACAVRLLDRGSFRIGSEGYAADNDSYGLATIRRDHVRLRAGVIIFDYPGKGGSHHLQQVVDAPAYEVVRALKRRRSADGELFAYKAGRHWRDLRSADINEYVKRASGDASHSAKDFRTWNATVLAAVALAVAREAARGSQRARRRATKWAIEEAARHLGNTPAVCRKSYIDPRIFDRFDAGYTIGGVLPELAGNGSDWPAVQRSVEEAVLDLLVGSRSRSRLVERVRPRAAG